MRLPVWCIIAIPDFARQETRALRILSSASKNVCGLSLPCPPKALSLTDSCLVSEDGNFTFSSIGSPTWEWPTDVAGSSVWPRGSCWSAICPWTGRSLNSIKSKHQKMCPWWAYCAQALAAVSVWWRKPSAMLLWMQSVETGGVSGACVTGQRRAYPQRAELVARWAHVPHLKVAVQRPAECFKVCDIWSLFFGIWFLHIMNKAILLLFSCPPLSFFMRNGDR